MEHQDTKIIMIPYGLWLRSDSSYKRNYIQKSTNETFTQEGKWRISKSQNRIDIHLKPFYMNDDSKTIDDTIFKSLSSFGTSLMVDNTLTGFRLLQNEDEGWYYNKVK